MEDIKSYFEQMQKFNVMRGIIAVQLNITPIAKQAMGEMAPKVGGRARGGGKASDTTCIFGWGRAGGEEGAGSDASHDVRGETGRGGHPASVWG